MSRSMMRAAAIVALCATPALTAVAQEGPPGTSDVSFFPPWQKGANNPADEKGLEFTVREADNLADFHGDLTNAGLILYVGGNYFFAMPGLVQHFEAKHPELKGRIYYETIPPGLLARQMKAAGRITVGNMTWTAKPDAYFAGLVATKRLVDEGVLVGPAVAYATNQLTIMVPKGNPAKIASLSDLGHPDIQLAMPNPEFEGVSRQVKAALHKAGGEALVKAVYETKVQDGTTHLTHMHHRQTPVWLMQGRAQAGVTWRSEALFQSQEGLATDHVDILPEQNVTGIYGGAVVKGAAHEQEARLWLDFLSSPEAQKIFAQYGFGKYTP